MIDKKQSRLQLKDACN